MKSRILYYFKTISFFSADQFGFRDGLSTEDAVIAFCSLINKGLDDKKSCAGLFVDITKAFDMVNHNVLLDKLFSAGFRGFILRWFSSYLKNRLQKVKIGESLSASNYLNVGVPQGSVLGPILFLVYINSLFYQSFAGKVKAFADDLGIAYVSDNPLNLIADINNDVSILRKWFACHKLTVSNKTKLMYFSLSSQEYPDLIIIFHAPNCERHCDLTCICDPASSNIWFNSDFTCNASCFKIDVVSQFRYLGILFDQNMSWSYHILKLKQHLQSSLRAIYHLEKLLDSKTLRMVYFGIFHSKLEYGLSCWGSAYYSKIQPLSVLQKYVIRKVCRSNRFAHTFELFKKLQILPVKHLFYYKVLKLFFLRSGYLQSPIYDFQNLRSASSSIVCIPSYRTTHFRNSFSVVAFKLFNMLPADIRSIRSLPIFLRKVKIWLFEYNHEQIKVMLPLIV